MSYTLPTTALQPIFDDAAMTALLDCVPRKTEPEARTTRSAPMRTIPETTARSGIVAGLGGVDGC